VIAFPVLQSLDEFIYLLLDHGYDDLASISQCTDTELADLVTLFSTQESKQSIRRLVEAIRQVGIDVYRKQKTEFRRLIDLDRVEGKHAEMAKQVSRVRSETLGKAASGLLTAAIQASQAATATSLATPVLSASSSTSPAAATTPAKSTPAATQPKSTPAASSPTSSSTSSSTSAVAGVANSPGTASLLAVQTPSASILKNTPASPTHGPIKLPPALSAAAAASASAAQANPTASFDVASWEGAIHFQAYLHSIQCYARAFDEPILAPHALEIKLLDGRTNVHLKKIQQSLNELTDGCIFKKFKRGSSATRLIWCSSAFDFVVWGDPDKSLIKGYINTHSIQEVNQGFASKNKNRLYIVSPERTLELEAKDGQQAREWKEKLELLIQLNMSELEQKQALQQSTGGSAGGGAASGTSSAFQSKFSKARAEYTKLICTGSVFKKCQSREGDMGACGSCVLRMFADHDRLFLCLLVV
jgi:hypothetical protein